MSEYNKMAKGVITVTGSAPPNAAIVQLPFQPDFVEFFNFTAATTPATNGVPFAFWDANMGQGTAVIQAFNGTPVLTTDVVATNGISTYYGGLGQQFGPTLLIASITKDAAAPVVTTTTNHNLASGQVVMFQGLYQTATTGMPQIAGIPFTVTVTGATTFTIPFNNSGSNYTALTGSPANCTVKLVLYPFLYFPGQCVVSGIALGTMTTVTTASAHNFRVGQEIAFRIPNSWGTIQLNSLPDVVIPGSPIYGYVVSVTNYNTFVCSINSTGYTAFNPNQTVANVPGEQFPQVVAVGDVNSGGTDISAGSVLYPPPFFEPIGTTQVNTINGPAIRGAFVNNTSQGFIIGPGVGATLTSAFLLGTAGNVIYYRAFLHDKQI